MPEKQSLYAPVSLETGVLFLLNSQPASEMMYLTAEISLYPLQEDYEPVILDFINRLHTCEGIQIHTNSLSTQISGSFHAVMTALSSSLEPVYSSDRLRVSVIKLLNASLPVGQEFRPLRP